MQVEDMLGFIDFVEAEDMTELATVMMVLTESPDDYQLAAWVADHAGFAAEYLASRRRLRDMPEVPEDGLEPVPAETRCCEPDGDDDTSYLDDMPTLIV